MAVPPGVPPGWATTLDTSFPARFCRETAKCSGFPARGKQYSSKRHPKRPGGETLRLVPALPPAVRPLYDIETHLAALVETEEVVPDEMQREFTLELQATLANSIANPTFKHR